MEAARVMAQNILVSNEPPENNFIVAFRKLTGRRPNENELELLTEDYHNNFEYFREHPNRMQELLSNGDYTIDENLDLNILAAHTLTISAILNLDETISKE